MLSSPEVWKEFIENYYWNDLNKLAEAVDFEQNRQDGQGKQDGLDSSRRERDGKNLVVDVKKDLVIFRESRLWEELRENPDVVVNHARNGLKLADNIYNVRVEGNIRLCNVPQTTKIQLKDLSNYLNRFVSMEGVVNNVTYKNPFVVEAAWKCVYCGVTTRKPVPDDNPFSELVQPYECNCGSRKFVFNDTESVTVDAQLITIQEYPENLNRGEEPRMVKVFAREDITGMVYPGDRVVINGIPKIRAMTNKKDRKAFRDLYVYANYIEVFESEYEEISITREEQQQIHEMSEDPELVNKIVKTIAPSIYGYENIKKAIALQLFGGKSKKLPDGTYKRGDIHILLVGDPGTGKSIISRWVKNVAPRAVLTTGTGTTGPGLTASAEKTEEGRWTIKAGALVLADKGVAIVDELDKMRKEELSSFNEALEQHTISIAKAGISTTLKSRVTLLAVANPKKERFDEDVSIPEQIGMPPTLLERFDLIFSIKDEPEEEKDAEISWRILEEEDEEEMSEEELQNYSRIDNDLFRKYIAYAKRNIHPKLTREAKDRIHKYYMDVRTAFSGRNSPVPISERQLQSIIRLTEASARMRLSNRAGLRDAEMAIDVLSNCLIKEATDPETGEIEIDRLYASQTKSRKDKVATIKQIIIDNYVNYDYKMPEKDILDKAEEHGIERTRAKDLLSRMRENGEIYCPEIGFFAPTYE